jgi:hypothetical protein
MSCNLFVGLLTQFCYNLFGFRIFEAFNVLDGKLTKLSDFSLSDSARYEY